MRAYRIPFLLIASLVCATVRAQDPSLTARLTKAATVDALDTVESQPWHAIVEAEIFDAKGSNPTRGTIEVWQSGSNRRTLYTFGSATMTEMVNGSAIFRTADEAQFPRFAPFLLAKVLHTGPVMPQVKQTDPQLQEREVHGEKFDCITSKPPANAISFSGPAYCLDTQDHLRALLNSQQTVLLDVPEEFLGHAVSRRVSVTNANVPVGAATITKLEVYEPSANEFVPTGEMKPFIPRARISGGVIAAMRTGMVEPVYPEAARAHHVSGSVVLRAIIGADGHIKTVEVVSSANAEFNQAAIDAVRQWTYKPYMLNGKPTEVDTTITVNFALQQ